MSGYSKPPSDEREICNCKLIKRPRTWERHWRADGRYALSGCDSISPYSVSTEREVFPIETSVSCHRVVCWFRKYELNVNTQRVRSGQD